MEELVRVMACYETNLVEAGLAGTREAAVWGLLMNPFISPKSRGIQAFEHALDAFELF